MKKGFFVLPASGLRSGEPQSGASASVPEREFRNASWSDADLASISERLRQTLNLILLPVGLSMRQIISSASLAGETLAVCSTAGASSSGTTPAGGAEGLSDATASTLADDAVSAGAGVSGPEDAHAAMHIEIAATESRPITVSPMLGSEHRYGL